MVIVYSERFLEHVQTPSHPESPQRLVAIRDALEANDLWKEVLNPQDPEEADILAVHDKNYISFLDRLGERALTPDTFVHRDTYVIAKLAAGCAILAAGESWEGHGPSLALVRPPGHHSGPSYGMGFCYLNNISIAAKKILRRARRIAIVDIDVHHGNGTQDAFYSNADVLYLSTHQKYIFPGTGHFNETGEGDGEGFTVNIPMGSGAGDASFEFAHERIVLPILSEYKPEMLLVSIGTDSHYRDPLASLTLSSKGHSRIVSQLLDFAKEHCAGRIAFYLEGGYDLETLSEIIAHTVGLFKGSKGRMTPLRYNDVSDTECIERESLLSIAQAQKDYWKIE